MKVLVSDKLDEKGLAILRNTKGFEVDYKPKIPPEELKKIIGSYEALLIRSGTRVTSEIIEAADKLKVIGRAGIGVDNVDIEAASKRGIVVMNTPLANTITTAEHALSLMLSLARRIPQAHTSLKSGKWEKGKFLGVEVYQKTLGVIGMGNIGKVVAQRALGIEMEVIAYDPYITREKADELGVELVELDDLFARSDFITIHTPLTDDTRDMINAESIAMMKDGVRIINCARGGIINEKDLAEAIEKGKVAGAAIDVFGKEPVDPDNPLLKLDAVVSTPHMGASTAEAQQNVSMAVVEQLIDFSRGIVRNAVNMPSLDPKLVSQIKPYLILAEKMGLFLGQIIEGRMKEIKIGYCGEVASLDVRPISMTLIEGMLRPILKEMVNLVNAPFLARERGVKVSETKSEECEDFSSVLNAILITDKGEISIAGALFAGGKPRIINLNGFYLEAVPEGHLLVFSNVDQPGVIGKIGTLLGNNRVNIAGMQLGRGKREGEAVAIVNVDSPIPDEVMSEIRNLPFIHFARLLKL